MKIVELTFITWNNCYRSPSTISKSTVEISGFSSRIISVCLSYLINMSETAVPSNASRFWTAIVAGDATAAKEAGDSLLNSGKRLYNDKVNQLMSFIYW